MVRILLILAFAWQPLALRAAMVQPVAGDTCALSTECCHPVREVTCCGEVIVHRVCDLTGAECGCSVRQRPDEPPVPRAPMPRAGDHTTTLFVGEAPAGTIEWAPATRIPMPPMADGVRCASSHNAARALTGSWRT